MDFDKKLAYCLEEGMVSMRVLLNQQMDVYQTFLDTFLGEVKMLIRFW